MDPITIHEYRLDYKPRPFNAVMNELKFPGLPFSIDNKHIGILVGSRGIKNLDRIVKRTVTELQDQGALPYIVPAMGSHGGATVEGQASLLAKYNITSERTGVKIVSSSEVVSLGDIFDNKPVVVNAVVNDLDYLVGINRVKPHPRFLSAYESGILKLLTVGLGFFEGAANFHRIVAEHGFEETLVRSSRLILDSLKFLFFLGIVEDRAGCTLQIEYIPPSEIYEREKELLIKARENIPSIPFSDVDLLVINEMGKNYSGSGIDTYVIGGRKGKKRISKRVYVRTLSTESEGNAVGMGLVDFISGHFYRSIDFGKTYRNVLSSMALDSAKMPLWFETDKEAIEYAAMSAGRMLDKNFRIVLINNTSDLSRIYVTPNLTNQGIRDYSYVGKRTISFDKNGNMVISGGT